MLIRMLAMPIACLSYQLNKNYIASALCVNKARPILKCNGQCFLKKQLEKANENASNGDQKSTVKSFTLDCFDEVTFTDCNPIVTYSPMIFKLANLPCSTGFRANIFHPPAVA
jgi:hypothetical protein